MVYNPNHPEPSCDVRLIFDSGSQRSYLTHDVKQRLALEPVSSETLNIRTFGNNNEQRQQCDTVLVGMVAKEGTTLCIPLLTVLIICDPLIHQHIEHIQERFAHLQGLDLADHQLGLTS